MERNKGGSLRVTIFKFISSSFQGGNYALKASWHRGASF